MSGKNYNQDSSLASSLPDGYGADDAIDDTEDLDDEYVSIKKTISETRRRQSKHSGDVRVQEVLPFQFLPNIRPLTISDIESCAALENAAFSDLEHRCSREKVTLLSPFLSSQSFRPFHARIRVLFVFLPCLITFCRYLLQL
jgi:hypothetical protein